MIAFLAFLKAIPLKTWLIAAAVVAAFTALMFYNSHEREIGRQQSAATIATLQAQLATAQAANAQFDATVGELKKSLADCESGRRADNDAMDKAKQDYADALDAFKKDDKKTRENTQLRLATTCREIANQPTCVTAAP